MTSARALGRGRWRVRWWAASVALQGVEEEVMSGRGGEGSCVGAARGRGGCRNESQFEDKLHRQRSWWKLGTFAGR